MGFAAGYSAGVQSPGRFSAIGEALSKLLSMGFDRGQQEREFAFKAQQQKTVGEQQLEQIKAQGTESRATAETTAQGQMDRDEAKRAAEKQAAADLATAIKAVAVLAPGHRKALLQAEIDAIDKNSDGIPDASQGPAPAPGPLVPSLAPGLSRRWDELSPDERIRLSALEKGAGMEGSAEKALGTAETSDVGILAQRAVSDPNAAARLDAVEARKMRSERAKGLEERTTDPAFHTAYYDTLDELMRNGVPEEKARDLARRAGAKAAEDKRMERTRILSGATEGRYDIAAKQALTAEMEEIQDQIAVADEDDPELPSLRARLDAIKKRVGQFPLPAPLSSKPMERTSTEAPTPQEAAAELARRRANKKGK